MGNKQFRGQRQPAPTAMGRHGRIRTPTRTVTISAVALALASVVVMQTGVQAAPSSAPTPRPATVTYTGGKLSYSPDSLGNTIPDFSAAGYRGGRAALPQAPVAVRVQAKASGDDTRRIQAAIGQVAKRAADAGGIRGAVLLGPGIFRVTAGIQLASGVVLRGSGTSAGGTRLQALGTPGSLIRVGSDAAYTRTGTRATISDPYVPVGATTLSVDKPASFTVGEQIVVQRPTTQEWIHAIGMDTIAGGDSWRPNSGILAVRTITAVKNKTLTLDAPLTTAIDNKYGGGTVWHYTLHGQVTEAGVENLSADATAFTQDPNYGRPSGGKNSEAGAFASRLITIDAARDVWVRNVRLTHFGSGFYVNDNASRVTIERADDLNMVVPARLAPPPAFMIGGQQVLVQDTTVTGDHIHAWTTQSFAAGPNVFTHGTATSLSGGHVDAGPHMKWGSGTLYDQLAIKGNDSAFIVANAADGGTGHGWQGANNVFWNTSAATYTIQAPPTADNWAFGPTGQQVPGKHDAELPTKPALGTIVSPGRPVTPASLFDQQVLERR